MFKHMRILIVNDTIQRVGGVEDYVYSLKELFTKKGHVVELFGSKTHTVASTYITRLLNPMAYCSLRRKVMQFNPEIIHFHNISRVLSPSVLLLNKEGRKLIMTVHDTHLLCPEDWLTKAELSVCRRGYSFKCLYSRCLRTNISKKFFLYRLYNLPKLWLHRYLIKVRIDCFVSPSRAIAQHFQESLGIKKIWVIPNFISLPSAKPQALKSSKTVLFVGRLSREKGVHLLIEAATLITKKGKELKFMIVGDGPERNRLEGLVKQNNLEDRVIFSGWREKNKLGDVYNSALMVVLPSICQDNSPIVALEAMYYGRPVVANRCGGLPDIVSDGKSGYLVKTGNSLDLAKKIETIADNFVLASEMGKTARKMFEENYGENDHYKKLLSLYKDRCL